MDLILWRHAEAEEAAAGTDDLARALTARGEKQAARMGAWLDRQLPQGVRVLCSPARRAVQTAAALNRKVKLRAELAPEGTAEDVLTVVGWPERPHPVLVVGHQPALGSVIAHLLGIATEDFFVRKGAVWWLRTRERGGRVQTIVVTVQTPELL